MAPMLDIPNNADYQKMIKIAEAVGIKYNLPADKQNDSDFIYVPSINLHVAKEKTLFTPDFYSTQKELHSKNQKILTIPEFKEFLKYTKENHLDVYKEITEVRSPWRSEWLDADFKVEGRDLVINYHIFDSNGKIIQKSKKLDKDTLMKNKIPGISLDSWLENSTEQGLPKKSTDSGNLYYWAPDRDNNSVTRFGANSDGAGLDCDGDPSGRSSELGVRAAKKLRE